MPSVEVCDGEDNDCDGATDEEVQRPCETACGTGIESCVEAAFGVCTARLPRDEVCDGLDNDCDGVVDDGCDAGVTDAGTPDAGLDAAGDAGSGDAGTPDADATDDGATDAGPADTAASLDSSVLDDAAVDAGDADPIPTVDGGLPEGGTSPFAPTESGGCNCRAAPGVSTGHGLVILGVLVLLAVRRRRR